MLNGNVDLYEFVAKLSRNKVRAEQKKQKCEKAGRSGYYALTLIVITTLHVIGLGNKL